jgi:hypothetical protein
MIKSGSLPIEHLLMVRLHLGEFLSKTNPMRHYIRTKSQSSARVGKMRRKNPMT